MKIKELKIIINSNPDLYIKEFFGTKKTIYELIDSKKMKIHNITYSQFYNLKSTYKLEVLSESNLGFTTRIYKINL